jgi:hypothetical protein
MRMDRRSFLKGMLAISAAAAVSPFLPPTGVAVAVAKASILDMAPIIDFSTMGRLGKVRIDRAWFPLEDAVFTMFRRYEPLLRRHNYSTYGDTYGPRNTEYPPTSFVPASEMRPLIDSPWQVQIWTPDQEIGSFFANINNLEFEFATRQASFVGNGFITEMESSNVIRRDDPDALLFSVTLEGSEKLRRFGEVGEEELI